jgi:hypothetical protein
MHSPGTLNGIIRVDSGGKRGFVAGAVVQRDVVVNAAPIIKYMIGWHPSKVRRYVEGRGWSLMWLPSGCAEDRGQHQA